MKTPLLRLVIAIPCLFGTILLGQTSEMTGKLLVVSSTTITLQKGTEIWDIKRTATTSVTGPLKVGSTITVKYSTPDAQKKEGTTEATNPTATPESQ